MNWHHAEHVLAILGAISILLHAVEAGCNAAGWTKYAGIFQKLGAFVQGFMGGIKPPTAGTGVAACIIVVLMGCSAMADVDITSTLKNIAPNTTPSLFYSMKQHAADFTTQYSLISKDTKVGTFEINAAYGESDTGLAVLAYKTDTLAKVGVNVLILKDLFANVGYGLGYDHISKSSRTFDNGFIAGLGADIKF